jgi:hypothetical protein
VGVLESQVRHGRQARRFAAAVLTLIALTGVPASSQSSSAAGLKGAYLVNFTQFVEWPADAIPGGAPLALCVVNDSAVADALEQTIKGRTVNGHALILRRLKAGEPLPTCHVLYLAGSDLKRPADVIETLNGKLVLTVSDASRFSRTGGMVELFLEDGRMRFAVNVDALRRAQVILSSRVLGLARIVKDADAP